MVHVSEPIPPGASSSADRDWGSVAACSTGLMFSLGTLLLYTFGVFAGPLIAEFHWTRTQVAFALALSQWTFAVASPFWGLLIDRFGPRPVLVPSTVALSALVASLGLLTPNLWHYYAVFTAVSFLAGGASPIGYSAVLIAKFERHLGLALGLALMGVGLGATILPPLSHASVEAIGWRGAYVVLGALTLVVTLPAALLATRNTRPRDKLREAGGVGVLPLVRTRAFIVMCVIFVLIGTVSVGGLANLVPIMISRGFSPGAAAQIASVTGVAAILGRGGVGFVLDRVHAPSVVCVVASFAAGSFLLIAFTEGAGSAYAAAALLGMVVGAEVDFTAYFVRRYFGRAVFGRLYGLAFGLFIVGSGTGPVLLSMSFDRFGSYFHGALFFAAASLVIAALTSAMPGYAVASEPAAAAGELRIGQE